MHHQVWIVSQQNVTRLAMKASFLWWRIQLRCYHLWLSFLLGATITGSNPTCGSFFQNFLCVSPRASSSFLYLFLFPSLLHLTSFFLLHEKHLLQFSERTKPCKYQQTNKVKERKKKTQPGSKLVWNSPNPDVRKEHSFVKNTVILSLFQPLNLYIAVSFTNLSCLLQ